MSTLNSLTLTECDLAIRAGVLEVHVRTRREEAVLVLTGEQLASLRALVVLGVGCTVCGCGCTPAPSHLSPGRYRAPDGREGVVHGFDPVAFCYTFEPDGFAPPAIVGPGRPDGRVRFGLEDGHLWTRIGDLP